MASNRRKVTLTKEEWIDVAGEARTAIRAVRSMHKSLLRTRTVQKSDRLDKILHKLHNEWSEAESLCSCQHGSEFAIKTFRLSQEAYCGVQMP